MRSHSLIYSHCCSLFSQYSVMDQATRGSNIDPNVFFPPDRVDAAAHQKVKLNKKKFC